MGTTTKRTTTKNQNLKTKNVKSKNRKENMARPKKTGLDYFPFDVDFFQTKK